MASTNDVQLLAQLLRKAIKSSAIELHTAMPAIVQAFDPDLNTVDVQPAIKEDFGQGPVALPRLNAVPVAFPQGGGGILSFPIAVGDTVLLVFSERSIDQWWVKNELVDPLDKRTHSLSDAFAIAGVSARAGSSARVSAEHVRLEHGNASIELQSDGKFKVSNLQGEELLDLLSQLADACSKISNSAGPTFNAATLATIKTKIDSLKGG